MKREKRPARRGELTPLTPADREKLQVASPAQAQLEDMSSELIQAVSRAGDDLQRYYVRLARAAEEEEPREQLDQDVEREIQSLRRTSANLRGAWRDTAAMEDELSARFADMRTSRDKKWYLPNPPSNAAIDLEEQERNHFARGINLYKILLVCFVGSFAGVVIEMLWCLIRNGYIESRAGLVYGPFNLLYGVGAVAVTVALYRFRNRGQWLSFLGGMAAGSIVEYVCSWGQEFFFGSRSWDYSNLPFNQRPHLPALLRVLGCARRAVDQEHLPPDGQGHPPHPQPGGEDPDLVPDGFPGIQRRDVLPGGGPLVPACQRCAGAKRLLGVY